MRELSPDIAAQLREQLDRAASGRPAREAPGAGVAADPGAAREAAAEAMFLVAAVDGRVTQLEIAQFADGVEKVFGEEAFEADVLVARFAAELAAEGWDRRLAAVKRVLAASDLREVSYRFAAAVAFVDDNIEHAEAAALEALAAGLDIDAERAQAILADVRADLFG